MEKKTNLAVMYLFDILISLAPILIPVLTSWDYYTESVGRSVSLGTGMTLLIIVVVLIALGKIPKNVNAMVLLIVFDIILFLLGDIITQLKWLIMAVIGGQVLSNTITKPKIRKEQERRKLNKQAEIITEKIKENNNE